MDGFGVAAPNAPGIVISQRSGLAFLAGLLREPLQALPAAAFEERMVLTRNFGRVRAYVSDPALIHEALVRNADSLMKSEEMKRVLGAALGDGLLTADGSTWRWQRQAIAPAFQHERLTALLPAMIGAAEATRDRWLTLPPGATVDLGHEMMQTTFRIILDTMLSGPAGMDAGRVETSVSDFLSATSWMFALAILKAPRWVPYPGRARAAAATRFMRGTIRKRVAARRGAATPGPDDLIGKMLAATDPESGRAMTDEDMTDNILTFIAAGHETTAIALSWTFAVLGAHPECAARLGAEIEAVTGDGPVRPAHIAELTYTRQVVSEAMRLYPPAPLIARSVERDLTVGGVTLPRGSILFVPIYAVHRHKGLWSRPDAFDPDRFTADAVRGRHRLAFLPFGVGARICIGSAFAIMEAVAILAVLAKAFAVPPIEGPLPEAQMRVTLRPAGALRMRVLPRDPSSSGATPSS